MGSCSKWIGALLLLAATAGCHLVLPYREAPGRDATSEQLASDLFFPPGDATLPTEDGRPEDGAPPELTVSTVAGPDVFVQPMDVAVESGNIYIADTGDRRIRETAISSGVVSTVAGTGDEGCSDGSIDSTWSAPRFSKPIAVAVQGHRVYVADEGCHSIRVVESRQVTTLAGSGAAGFADGIGASAQFDRPSDLVVDSSGVVYVADRGNNRIRKIVGNVVSTFAGSGEDSSVDGSTSQNGTGPFASFAGPVALTLGNNGELYVVQANAHAVRLISGGQVSTYYQGLSDSQHPRGVAVIDTGRVLISTSSDNPTSVVGNEQIFILQSGALLGTIGAEGAWIDGPQQAARFNGPFGLTWYEPARTLYVADKYNDRIRSVTGL